MWRVPQCAQLALVSWLNSWCYLPWSVLGNAPIRTSSLPGWTRDRPANLIPSKTAFGWLVLLGVDRYWVTLLFYGKLKRFFEAVQYSWSSELYLLVRPKVDWLCLWMNNLSSGCTQLECRVARPWVLSLIVPHKDKYLVVAFCVSSVKYAPHVSHYQAIIASAFLRVLCTLVNSLLPNTFTSEVLLNDRYVIVIEICNTFYYHICNPPMICI